MKRDARRNLVYPYARIIYPKRETAARMRPRLRRLSSGTQQEMAEIPLDTPIVTIGRDAANVLRLEDPMVSSRHCRIECKDDEFVLSDRESTNGTFVNGKAVAKTNLKHGDEIMIGRTRLCFLVDDDITKPNEVLVDDVSDINLISSETIQLSPQDSAYLRAGLLENTGWLHRVAEDMGVLLELSAEINSILDSAELQRVLMDRIFQRIPAENGVMLLGTDLAQLFLGSPLFRHRSSPTGQVPVSRTIVQQVFSSGESVLRNDLLSDGDASQSIRAARLRSVLCVPLTAMHVRIGVIYLSTSSTASPFDARHLELVTGIAGIAALALEHARYVEWLEVENRQLIREVSLKHEMVGENPKMKKVYETIELVAPTNSPVLVLGESGTGKELAARAVHGNSNRRNGPFVAVNCGAIVETLFASQLFGYVKGAFTGADRDHKGLIEEADGGTLFLDELGDLPLHCQAALLRVLEDSNVQRVGSSRQIAVDVRVISATNRSLTEEIRKGNFRSDLYFRMGLPIELPPLRERMDDIPLLVRFFIQKHKGNTQRELGATPPDTIRVLQQYSWPGNVRELGRAIYWAVVFGKSDRIRPDDLPPEILKGSSHAAPAVLRLDDALENYERQLIIRALEETHGNVVDAAVLLARAPNYLQRRISHLKLREELERIRSVGKISDLG